MSIPLRDDHDLDDRTLLTMCRGALATCPNRPLTASTIEDRLRHVGVITTRARIAELMGLGEALGFVAKGKDTTRNGVVSPRWSAGPVPVLPPGDLRDLAAAARGVPRQAEPTGDVHLDYMVRLTTAMERLCLLLEKDVPGPLFNRNGKVGH